jgi:hypothetical protein
VHQPCSLSIVEVSFQPNRDVDLIEHAAFSFAVGTVRGVNTRVAKSYVDAFQLDALPLRIHAECHGYSSPKGGKQILIWIRSSIGSAMGFRLVSDKHVPPGFNLLSEPLPRHRTHDNNRAHRLPFRCE